MDSRLRPFGLLFNRSLNDMIRGMRKRKDPVQLAEYLRSVIAECREEARSPDLDVKSVAILKLAYLEMYGFDMAWAGFHVLEVMSSPKFQQKRIGYMAAMQTFRDPELLMLATNLLKNDLASTSEPRVAVALSGLASIVTPFLAQDVSDDIMKMLNHSRSYIRKKALLAMYKVVLQYPETLDAVIARIHVQLQNAQDEDPSVVTAAVNVLCELANQTPPQKIVPLAPSLYDLLLTCKNNWCLIKILKLFSRLATAEPRLVPKLLPHIIELMQTTNAMSLKYECINSVLRGDMLDPDDYPLANQLVSHTRTLMVEHDQNLKYVGLVALSKIIRVNSEFLSGKDASLVIDAVDDQDLSIRRRALDMLLPLVNDDNLYEIVNKLVEQLKEDDLPSGYALQLVNSITDLCSAKTYAYVPNFEWYVEVLVHIVELNYARLNIGDVVGAQLQDIAVRVRSVRSTVVAASVQLSLNSQIVKKQPTLLNYTMWIVGEYISYYFTAANISSGADFISSLLSIRATPIVVSAVTKVFAAWIQLYSYWSRDTREMVSEVVAKIIAYLDKLSYSADAELQERSSQFLELFRLGAEALDAQSDAADAPPALLTVAFPSLFAGEINPIARNAQRRLALPPDVDFDTPVDLPEIDFSESEEEIVSESEPEEIIETKPKDRKLDPYYIGPVKEPDPSSTPSIDSDTPSAHSRSQSRSETPPAPVAVKKKIQKVKVDIAQDEDVDGEVGSPKKEAKAFKSPLFQVNTRLKLLDLEATSDSPSEVLVKHKTKKKKDRSKKEKKKKKVDNVELIG